MDSIKSVRKGETSVKRMELRNQYLFINLLFNI